MSEQVQYASGGDSATNKRKYETDQSPPLPLSGGRRSTGFSAPISSQSPDSAPSYNSVPLPDEIELAKQRAQEIAARLYNTAEAKRPRVENGGYDSGDAKGFSLGPTDYGQKPIMNAVASVPAYGFPGPSKKIEIPNGRVGVIIGKQGETIKYLQLQSGAKIQVTRDSDTDPNSLTREVELTGTPDQIAKAEQLINNVLKEAETGGSGTVSRRVTGLQYGEEQFVTKIPNNKVGLIIGKGGETIKSMQNNTGARIQVIPLHLPPGDTSTERTLQIDGTSEQIDAAKVLVNEIISENRLRNTRMGYSQHGYQAQGYQSQPPPASWGPPPGHQQTGYGGYGQPGYPGQTPQYNMSQPQYPGYPPQPAPGGYATTGWDQTTNQQQQQQQTTQGGGGYDYYNLQQPQQTPGGGSGPADNSAAYGYNQQAASGYNQQGQHQGYTQDAFGGYQQPGYGQPPLGYDQQQQGYNVANPTPEGQPPSSYGAPPQGDNTGNNQAPQPTTTVGGPQGYNNPTSQQQPSPNPSYPPTQPGGYGMPPPTSQTGYGTQPPSAYGPGYGAPPPAQKPAAYGQPPQQSPTGQAGYGQPSPVQPGYPTQAGYGSAMASGYGPPPYGTQPSYGGQQPPAYNSPYGSGGYSQPPPAAADGNGAPPAAASQAVPPPSGVAKASPQG